MKKIIFIGRELALNKCELAFLLSHLKKAIYNLECANKLVPNSIDEKLIEELKCILIEYKIKLGDY